MTLNRSNEQVQDDSREIYYDDYFERCIANIVDDIVHVHPDIVVNKITQRQYAHDNDHCPDRQCTVLTAYISLSSSSRKSYNNLSDSLRSKLHYRIVEEIGAAASAHMLIDRSCKLQVVLQKRLLGFTVKSMLLGEVDLKNKKFYGL